METDYFQPIVKNIRCKKLMFNNPASAAKATASLDKVMTSSLRLVKVTAGLGTSVSWRMLSGPQHINSTMPALFLEPGQPQ